MTIINLEAGWEKLAPDSPFPNLKRRPLYHQVRTLKALQQYDLVMNSYNTGTGKTFASLLYLFDLNQANEINPTQQKNVLFIAPTNALISQHAQDIQDFVKDNNLDFKVLTTTAPDIRAIESGLRSGETLYRRLRNYLEYETENIRRQPTVTVTNPDIFYYALYFRYHAHDRRNIFSEFIKRFDYIVVDEFHYYDYKQLANFLFAFALFDQLGYFEKTHRRKICLLSATPDDPVRNYLNQLFDTSRWTEIGPHNEPPESDSFERVPTLTPLELTIQANTINEWLQTNNRQLAKNKKDGAIISSSLAQVNEAYGLLQTIIPIESMGRITGPENQEDRLQATARRLILATPTVDIGYNFVKKGKKRQNIDFVILDARFGDELIQRMGRTGRVLGKPEYNNPSQAIALLSSEAANALLAYDGQTLSRSEFKEIVRSCGQLPPKHTLTSYIRTYAITESFWPIYQFGQMLPPNMQSEIDALLNRVKEIFDPKNRQTQKGLKWFFDAFQKRQMWLKATEELERNLDKQTTQNINDWAKWLQITDFEEWMLTEFSWQGLREFVQSEVAKIEALFSFRDSFQGPTAIFYDPKHLLSNQTVNSYDLFHLIRNYELSPLLSRKQFEQNCHPTNLQADFYVELQGFRDPKLQLVFVYRSEDDRYGFERQWCNGPVALTGIQLSVREYRGDIIAGELKEAVVNALAEKPLTMLIIPPDSIGAMISKLRGTNLWAQPLTVHFEDGTSDEQYNILLGTAAFMAYAELKGHFLMKERLKPEPIII